MPQVTLKHHPSPDPRMDPSHADHRGALAFPPGSVAIFVGKPNFGCLAEVLPPLAGEHQVCSFQSYFCRDERRMRPDTKRSVAKASPAFSGCGLEVKKHEPEMVTCL